MGNTYSGNDGLHLQSYAWFCSLLLHALVLGASLLFMQYLTHEPFPEPFRLDVTLVGISDVSTDISPFPVDDQKAFLLGSQTGLTQPTQEREHNTETDVAALGDTMPASPLQVAPHQAPKTPVSEKARLSVLNQEVPTAMRSDVPSKPQQPEKHTRIQAPPRSSIEEPSAPVNAFDEASSSVNDRQVPAAPPPPISAEAIRAFPAPSVPISDAGSEHAHLPQVRQATDHEPTEPIGEEPNLQQVTTQQVASLSPPHRESSAAPPLAQPGTQDYGWLQHILSHKLDQLKRQSRPMLNRHGKVRVLLRLVILEGGDLADLTVERSSGEDSIDQEAMTLVQRAFPLPLNHALGRSQVVVRIPLSYSLSAD
jgi:periplasmic protein TonB